MVERLHGRTNGRTAGGRTDGRADEQTADGRTDELSHLDFLDIVVFGHSGYKIFGHFRRHTMDLLDIAVFGYSNYWT